MLVARAGVVVSLLLLTAAAVPAQDMPQPPTPGPEHKRFRMDEGTWDAGVELQGSPGAPPMQSTGVEVNTVGCNSLCLITDFTSEIAGMPFAGHGIATWDPTKKKYVSSWSDSMSAGLSLSEATRDEPGKRMVGQMEATDPQTGRTVVMTSVVEYRNGGRVMAMYMPGPDGKDVQSMRITYTKRK
ncbi:MAG TPA: DUF1579 family protein [Vicinamibacterales bacterium]